MRFAFVVFVLGMVFSPAVVAQKTITGLVTDEKDNPLTGANVYWKGSYSGTITDTAGNFRIAPEGSEFTTLVISYIGYEEAQLEIPPGTDASSFHIRLKEKVTEVKDVVISAGTFGSADAKKSVILNPFDIVTTASAMGDVYGALQTLPGNSFVGEDGGLFVRGGEGYETRTFIDGLLVHKPYTSRTPDLPARGRFSPMLFSGTMFSTGGFSAEYGQALSSALILTTEGVAERRGGSVGVLPFGESVSYTSVHKGGSASAALDYYNMKPYFSLIRQEIVWEKAPVSLSGSVVLRKKLGRQGILKVFAATDNSHSILSLEEPGSENRCVRYDLQNSNGYLNMAGMFPLKGLWSMKTGISFTADKDNIWPGADHLVIRESGVQVKQVFCREERKNISLKTGFELNVTDYRLLYRQDVPSFAYSDDFTNKIAAGFAEAEWKMAGTFSIRGGFRGEYTGCNNDFLVSPRISAAVKTSDYSQISAAWGIYRQLPETGFLRIKPDLMNQRAEHILLNYQWIKSGYTLRTEIYAKQYRNLVRYDTLYNPDPAGYSSSGKGYARGIDIFWRDKKTFKNGDYWLSYSYIDTRRLYRDYPVMVRPPWFPEHTFSAVYKQFFQKAGSLVSASFMLMSGRPYEDPNKKGFMNQRTPVYSDLSVSYSYVFIRKSNLYIFHVQVTNVLGQDQIYGYRFATQPDEEGFYASKALRPPARRMIVTGIFVYFNYF